MIYYNSELTAEVSPLAITMAPCRNIGSDFCDYIWPRHIPSVVTVNCTYIAPLDLRIEWEYFMTVRHSTSVYTERNAGDHYVTDSVHHFLQRGDDQFEHFSSLVIRNSKFDDVELVQRSNITCVGYIDDEKVAHMSVQVGHRVTVPWYYLNEVEENEKLYLFCDLDNMPLNRDSVDEIELLKYDDGSKTYWSIAAIEVHSKSCQLKLDQHGETDVFLKHQSRDRILCNVGDATLGMLNLIINQVQRSDTGLYMCSGRRKNLKLPSSPFYIDVVPISTISEFSKTHCQPTRETGCDHVTLTCIAHGSRNLKIEWAFSPQLNEAQQFKVKQGLSLVYSHTEDIDGRLFRHEQVVSLNKIYQRYLPSCMVGNTRQETVLADNNIINKMLICDNDSFTVTCSSQMFHLSVGDVDHLEISRLSPSPLVLVTYSMERDPFLHYNTTHSGAWTFDSANSGGIMIVKATIKHARCSDTGWYQCTAVTTGFRVHSEKLTARSKVLMKGQYVDISDALIHGRNCLQSSLNTCVVVEGKTFHVNCSVKGPYDVSVRWLYNITDYPYQTREVHNMAKLGPGSQYCDTFLHEFILTVHMASLKESVKYTCQFYVGQKHTLDKWIKIDVKPSDRKLKDKLNVKENGSVQLSCNVDMFNVSVSDVEYLQIRRSSVPVMILVTYRPGEFPYERSLPRGRQWEVKYNAVSVVVIINNVQCSDSGFYGCVVKLRDTPADKRLVKRFEITVTGLYDKMRDKRLNMPRCRNVRLCHLQVLPDISYEMGCSAVGPPNLRVNLITEGPLLNFRTRRKAVDQNQYCPLVYSEVQIDVVPTTSYKIYKCEFSLNEGEAEYHEIAIEQDKTEVQVHDTVNPFTNEPFSIVCSRLNPDPEKGPLKYLEIHRSAMSATLLPEDRIVSYRMGQDREVYSVQPDGRHWSADLSPNDNMTVNLTIMDAKCSDSGYYFCSARADSDGDVQYQVLTDMHYVNVTDIEKLRLHVDGCVSECETDEGRQIRINCSFTFGSSFHPRLDIHWYQAWQGKKVNISLTSSYRVTTKSVTVERDRQRSHFCDSENLYRMDSVLTIESASSEDDLWFICESHLHSERVRHKTIKVYVRETKMVFSTTELGLMSVLVLGLVTSTGYVIIKGMNLMSQPEQFADKEESGVSSRSDNSGYSETVSNVSDSSVTWSEISSNIRTSFGEPNNIRVSIRSNKKNSISYI
ncbi:hypothetical protein Btru_068217 [Bulinus truncatus]|nr:hypothetical protein Btru_068217 [Bulinus truncatus]